jgi:hypothetical protein
MRREYGIVATKAAPARRGYYGETWKIDAAAGRSYFAKLDYTDSHKALYERSFPIIERLCEHGIDFISRVVKTSCGALSTRYGGAVLGVFDWIGGKNVETDATKLPEYRMLAKVYTVSPDGIDIFREDFAAKSVGMFFKLWDIVGSLSPRSPGDGRILALFEQNRQLLERRAGRLKHFAALCRRGGADGFFITHGDAGGNLVIEGGRHYIVDWDEAMLSPPERDAWNMFCFKGWAKCLFQKALRENGISYELRHERLAYYCYFYVFYYLTEYLTDYLSNATPSNVAEELEQYFHGWAENRASFADKYF